MKLMYMMVNERRRKTKTKKPRNSVLDMRDRKARKEYNPHRE
jgi:hypothetical protein